MGQQQLILLVLATVIVGLAIVVGIRAFTENSAKANSDAMTQDAVRIASDMQAWKKKPAPFGGQASVNNDNAVLTSDINFTGVTFPLLGYEQDGEAATATRNLNGLFTLEEVAASPIIRGVNALEGNVIAVRICGSGDIRGEILQLRGEPADPRTPSPCVAN
jgi:hypothetical protein